MTQFRRFCPYLPICWLLRFFFLKVNIKSWTRSSPPWHIVCDSWLYKPICPLTNVRFWKQSQQSEARTIIASHHHTFLIFPSFSWIFIVLHIVLCVGDRQARSDIWKIWSWSVYLLFIWPKHLSQWLMFTLLLFTSCVYRPGSLCLNVSYESGSLPAAVPACGGCSPRNGRFAGNGPKRQYPLTQVFLHLWFRRSTVNAASCSSSLRRRRADSSCFSLQTVWAPPTHLHPLSPLTLAQDSAVVT